MSALIRGVLGGALAGEPIEVELLDDDQAQVMSVSSGETSNVPRRSLPAAAREGDIVVSGSVDLIATEAGRARIQELQRSAVPIPAGLSLDERETPPLTPRRVR